MIKTRLEVDWIVLVQAGKNTFCCFMFLKSGMKNGFDISLAKKEYLKIVVKVSALEGQVGLILSQYEGKTME